MIKLKITNRNNFNQNKITHFLVTYENIQLLDENGKVSLQSNIDPMESIMSFVEKVGFNIPSACRAGACFACACKVNNGEECLDQEKYGSKLIETIPGEFLSCIGGIKDEYLKDENIHIIDLEIVG